ncbi:DUF998 domain-containing protein [soil metagenome]
MSSIQSVPRQAVAGTKFDATRFLLTCGVIAGPIYVIVGTFQIFIRPGFDMSRHALSLMSNGPLGWIQISNFIVTGVLILACAIGMRRALYPGKACTWGPILLFVYGLGLIGAGIFIADPALGFPPGTPDDKVSISLPGILHFFSGAVGFFGLIAACFVFTRRFFAFGLPGWGWFSLASGILFLASFMGVASGAGKPILIVAFYLGVALAWTWISAVSLLIMRQPHHEGNVGGIGRLR